MNCKEAKSQIALLVGNDLEPRTAATLRRHLDACPCCRDQAQSLTSCIDVLQSDASTPWNTEPGSLWPGLQVRLASQRPVEKPHRMNGWAPALAVAAAGLAMVWFTSSRDAGIAFHPDGVNVQPVSMPANLWQNHESLPQRQFAPWHDRSLRDQDGRIIEPDDARDLRQLPPRGLPAGF